VATCRVLCLAFSRREGGNCFAGIEIDTGSWVRPVRDELGGPLYDHECLAKTPNGFRCPQVLDVIELELLSHCPKLGQPENRIMGTTQWEVVGRRDIESLRTFVSDDPELFRGYDRFVSASEVQTRPPTCSLCLISPGSLIWLAEVNRYGRRRILGRFTVCGQSYTLPLTDDAYAVKLADIEISRSRSEDLSAPLFLTLSLGDVWKEQNRHYKLIAGVAA
jgi:hypothetical protein